MDPFVLFLKSLHSERKLKNKRYSLRAFAAHCGISIGQINDYFSGRRNISKKTKIKILGHLNLSPKQQTDAQRLLNSAKKTPYKISPENFAVVADPTHFAFLALMTAKDFRYDPIWITRKLNITPQRLKKIVSNLMKTNMIALDEKNLSLKYTEATTDSEIPSKALRASHIASLQRIIKNLDLVPIEKRSVTSVSLCIDPKKIPMAKKRILNFIEKTARLLESGKKEDVYEINVQLFPWQV